MTAITAVPTNRTTRTTTPKRRSAAALLAVVLLALVAAGCMPSDAKTFLDRTNSLRSSHGLRTLKENDTLTEKAEAWARHMAATGRLEHSNLSSGLGGLKWKALGENVAYSSPTSNTLLTIHNMFVSSAGHRANLLKSNYTHMGVGVAKDSRGRIWVAEVFAQL
jgi:uncharacterized protein YkwD